MDSMAVKGLEVLNNGMENEDWTDRIHINVQNNIMTGEYGPGLESVVIDLSGHTLEFEDYFSETKMDLGDLYEVYFDDELDFWVYNFSNGVQIIYEN